MNNLDPEVAEHPDELVVYGGTGRAARSWEAFDALVATLRTLEDQPNSLSVLSAGGGPAGEAPLSIQALLNPLSKAAQQLAPVLLLLRRAFDVDMQIVLNPQASVCV